MRKLLFIIPLLITACTHRTPTPTEPAQNYAATFYAPTYSKNFKIKALSDTSTQRLLEVYLPDTLRITIPEGGYKSIICLSSTYIGYLAEANAADRISGVSRRDLVTNNIVKNNAVEVGYDGAFDYEAILTAKPDIMLIYGINGPNPIVDKLNELGIKYVYIHDFDEQHPLGRAEWLVALGTLVGMDMRDKFAKIAASYRPAKGDTKVMLNAPYSGIWFIPGRDNYMSRLIADAGGRVNAPQPVGSKSEPLDMEIALPSLNGSDIWLNPGQVNSIAEANRLAPHGKFAGEIWNQKPDFYESGAARPDLVLEEIKRIFSHDESIPFTYFTRLE